MPSATDWLSAKVFRNFGRAHPIAKERRGDACRVSRDNAPGNLIRRFILNALKLDTAHPEKSARLRRKKAGRDDDERMRIPGMKPL
jgi:hypothetical protein